MKKFTILLIGFILGSVSLFGQREQDSLALIKIYEATDGTNWSMNTNWLSTEPISTWFGVKVANERVTTLALFGNNLKGSIPADIGNLTALTTLIINDNPQLTGAIPTEIGNLTALTFLSLRNDNFSGAIPTSLGNLIHLTRLDLSNNPFSRGGASKRNCQFNRYPIT